MNVGFNPYNSGYSWHTAMRNIDVGKKIKRIKQTITPQIKKGVSSVARCYVL